MKNWEEGCQRDHHRSSFLYFCDDSLVFPCLFLLSVFPVFSESSLFFHLSLFFCVFPYFNHSLYITFGLLSILCCTSFLSIHSPILSAAIFPVQPLQFSTQSIKPSQPPFLHQFLLFFLPPPPFLCFSQLPEPDFISEAILSQA